VALRLVPVRRTDARVDAGSGGEPAGVDEAGANGRSLLVRVPFAERVLVVDPSAEGAAPVPADVDCDEFEVGAWPVLAGVRAAAGFLAPAPPEPPLPEPDGVEPVLVDPALAGAAVRFWADVEGFLVGFSALMEQRYAVTFARRESDQPRPAPGTGSRRTLAGPIPQRP
jgi:hypothetical protein